VTRSDGRRAGLAPGLRGGRRRAKARLGERIGSLSDARVEQIMAGLRFQQASFFAR
jgi:hypothetical protein